MTPARYPANNTEELQAVITFLSLLDIKYVKPSPNWLDKIPNTDGQVEIVDENQQPLGKLEIQIKKIPDGETSFQCPLELIAYSEKISLPFFLVCVDVGNKRAYFRHLHRLMMPPELKPEQQSFVVKFDPKVHSISGETQYRLQWLEIIQEYNRRISDYARLRQIENQLNPSHISKEDRIYFQEFIEHLNHLLDFDFPVVKEQFFKGVWKLGVGVSSADQNEVVFQIYTIHPGDPAILVSGIPNNSRTVTFTFGQGQRTFQYNFKTRSALKSARQEAASFVFENLRKVIQDKRLSLCGKRMATEYLFWFVDNFGQSIGIEEADRLNVAQLNYGISIYLPAWASIAVPKFLGEIIRLNKHNLEAAAHMISRPSFEHIACAPSIQPSKAEVLSLIQSGNTLRPIQVCFYEVSPQSLIEAVDVLSSANEEWIEHPYRPRTSAPNMIWSGYDVEALRHNIRTILVNSLDEYRMFVERNRIPLKNSFYLHRPAAIVYVANLTEWANARGFNNSPHLKRYFVKNEDNKIPKITLIDTSEVADDLIVEKQTLNLKGIEREIIGWGDVGPDGLFDKLPILNRFYSMLQNDLQDEFKDSIE